MHVVWLLLCLLLAMNEFTHEKVYLRGHRHVQPTTRIFKIVFEGRWYAKIDQHC
jgi:hypothetical protein